MRSRFIVFLAVLFGCVVQLLQLSTGQQLQCGELDVENSVGQPMSGRDLSVCSSDNLQCCLQTHIDAVTEVARNRLALGLRLQMRETSVKFNAAINSIKSYFTTGFRNSLIGALPSLSTAVSFSQLESVAGPVIDTFIQNIATANATELIIGISEQLATGAGASFSDGSNASIFCIRNALLNAVNQTDVALLARGLTTVQNALNTFERFSSFLYRYRMNGNFTFPRDCVRRFVELNFCSRCTRRTPPLCSNTCGALFRGCLSPYYTVLNRQFDLIWNVSRQVLRITNNTLQTLFANERSLIDATNALRQAGACEGFSPPIGKRQTNRQQNMNAATFIPQQRMMELEGLTGRGFSYEDDQDRSGPLICQPSDEEVQFCNNDTQRGDRNYCSSRMDCTSECLCYDGRRDRMMNNSAMFDGNGIDEQMNNPAINLTDQELTTIVGTIGTPARSFLMQADVMALLPEGVTLPPDDTTTTPMPGHGSSVAFTLSLMALPLAVIIAAFF